MRSKTIPCLLTALGLSWFSVNADAVSIFVDPSLTTVTVGGPVSVDIKISGLGNTADTTLGAFDIKLNFDPSRLALTSPPPLTGSPPYGTGLNLGDLSGNSSDQSTTIGLGFVELAETSLLSPSVLVAGQPDDFVLGTLIFQALTTIGLSNLTLTLLDSGDADGNPFATLPTLQNGQVQINSPTAAPEPATGLLLLAGLLGLSGYRFSRRIQT